MTIEELASRALKNADKVAKVIPARAAMTNIYFIQAGDDGPIKIGSTSDATPARRLMDLQVGNPYPLRVLHYIPAIRALEKELHSILSAYRMSGEWFEPHPMVIELGNAILSQSRLELLEANWLTEKEGFEPSFDAKAHSHWPVLQRPTSATGKAA